MSSDDRQHHERALHSAEVRLWVCERELERLGGHVSPAAREDLKGEAQALTLVVEAERRWLAAPAAN